MVEKIWGIEKRAWHGDSFLISWIFSSLPLNSKLTCSYFIGRHARKNLPTRSMMGSQTFGEKWRHMYINYDVNRLLNICIPLIAQDKQNTLGFATMVLAANLALAIRRALTDLCHSILGIYNKLKIEGSLYRTETMILCSTAVSRACKTLFCASLEAISNSTHRQKFWFILDLPLTNRLF